MASLILLPLSAASGYGYGIRIATPFFSSSTSLSHRTSRLLKFSSRKPQGCRASVAVPVLNWEGEASAEGEVKLDLRCARPETARAVVHRGLITEQQNKRRGTASTLTRGEVRGGGRKPYKQKKTGRARRGSQRTPLRPGGGIIFGPKPRDWSIKINRKEKRLAISTALQRSSSAFIVVDDFEDAIEPKTKSFLAAISRWGADPSKPSLLFTMNPTENLIKSSRNLSTLKLMTPRNLNLFDVLKAHKLIFTRSSIDYLNQSYGIEDEVDESDEEDEAAASIEEEEEEEESSDEAV